MGKLNTAPRQAHCILRLLNTACKTPVMLIVITTKDWWSPKGLISNKLISFFKQMYMIMKADLNSV